MRDTVKADTATAAGGLSAIFMALFGGVARNADDVMRGAIHFSDDAARVAVQPLDDIAARSASLSDDVAVRFDPAAFQVESHASRIRWSPAHRAEGVHLHVESWDGLNEGVARGMAHLVRVQVNGEED